MDIKKTIFQIISKKTDVKPSLELTLEEANVDSLDLIEVILEIEKAFSIRIEDEKLNSIDSLGDLVKIVEEKVNK